MSSDFLIGPLLCALLLLTERLTGSGLQGSVSRFGGTNLTVPADPYLCVQPQPLQQVHYAKRYPEVDFFRSLGTLVPAQTAFWFRGEDGTMSATGKDLVMQTEEWRKQYWATFHASFTTKLTDWEHEQEYRITLQSSLVDLSNPAERTLKYRVEDLRGIVFGMNMSAEDRASIAAKCQQTGRTDFEFDQAYYSRLTGKVDAALWDLVKVHPTQTALPSPPKATSWRFAGTEVSITAGCCPQLNYCQPGQTTHRDMLLSRPPETLVLANALLASVLEQPAQTCFCLPSPFSPHRRRHGGNVGDAGTIGVFQAAVRRVEQFLRSRLCTDEPSPWCLWVPNPHEH